MDEARVLFRSLLVVLVVTGTAGAAIPDTTSDPVQWGVHVGGTTDPASWHTDHIKRTVTLSLTPETPGSVSVTVSFDLPASVRQLETTVPENATVVSVDGFDRVEPGYYEWDGDTVDPRITFFQPTNETDGGLRRRGTGGLVFADPGPWAIVRVPQFETRWSYVGAKLGFASTVTTDGPGASGGEIAFLGEHETYERDAAGQSFTLVVPSTATLAATPNDVLGVVANASAQLDVGGRDPSVFLVAAPTSVPGGVGGFQFGPDDAWVVADAPLDEPNNIWLHEYVHTRQEFTPSPEMAWLTEAIAEYYAAYFTYRDGAISFETFRTHLAVGTAPGYRDVVLTDPARWGGDGQYRKGALVVADLDRRIRNATGGISTFASVWAVANRDQDELTATEFHGLIETASTVAVATDAKRYVGTSAVPDVWDKATHESVFDGPVPVFEYRIGSLAVDSEYRNQALSGPAVVGETVVVPVVVSNVGDASGSFEAVFTVDDVVVNVRRGTIAAGENRTVVFSFTPSVNRTYRVGVGTAVTDLVVVDPATPTVTDLSVPSSVLAGETVPISVTVANTAVIPANGSISVTVDDTTIATEHVRLAANDTVTFTTNTTFTTNPAFMTNTTFTTNRTAVVRAGDIERTVTVMSPETPTPVPSAPVQTPGFGFLAVVYMRSRRMPRGLTLGLKPTTRIQTIK